jgi:hypothetical protein
MVWGHRTREATLLILALIYATILDSWSAARAALTVPECRTRATTTG